MGRQVRMNLPTSTAARTPSRPCLVKDIALVRAEEKYTTTRRRGESHATTMPINGGGAKVLLARSSRG